MPVAPILIAAIALLEKLIPMINQLREQARQNAELTPDQERELDDRIERVTSQPHWQPTPPPSPVPPTNDINP